MSHISTGVEYGLHCLLYLSDPVNDLPGASVRDLAELQGVSVDYLAKLFTKLHKAGIVNGMEGVRGGFTLAKPAEDISVLDVVLAIDGDKPLFECREIRSRCALFDGNAPTWATSGVCSIHAVMQSAEKRMHEALASQTLASLAARTVAKAPRNFSTQVVKWIEDRAAGRRDGRGTGKTPGTAR